jgi:peptide deformylase
MIITDESILRTPCEDVLPEEVDDIVVLLEQELKLSAERGNEGIGLAAPQIGIFKKVAIVRLGKYSINLINPIIEQKYDLQVFDGEGCLSFPGKKEKTRRYMEVVVSSGSQKFIATDLLAVVIQHETDHLYNKLLPDYAIKEEVKKLSKPRPNDLCSCGSNIKAKKCCFRTGH